MILPPMHVFLLNASPVTVLNTSSRAMLLLFEAFVWDLTFEHKLLRNTFLLGYFSHVDAYSIRFDSSLLALDSSFPKSRRRPFTSWSWGPAHTCMHNRCPRRKCMACFTILELGETIWKRRWICDNTHLAAKACSHQVGQGLISGHTVLIRLIATLK